MSDSPFELNETAFNMLIEVYRSLEEGRQDVEDILEDEELIEAD